MRSAPCTFRSHCVPRRLKGDATSAWGQTQKSSERAYVFRIGFDSRPSTAALVATRMHAVLRSIAEL